MERLHPLFQQMPLFLITNINVIYSSRINPMYAVLRFQIFPLYIRGCRPFRLRFAPTAALWCNESISLLIYFWREALSESLWLSLKRDRERDEEDDRDQKILGDRRRIAVVPFVSRPRYHLSQHHQHPPSRELGNPKKKQQQQRATHQFHVANVAMDNYYLLRFCFNNRFSSSTQLTHKLDCIGWDHR